jgi:cytochrome c551/c552
MFSKRMILTVLAAGVLAFLVIQLIPVDKTNPSVSAEPAWDSPQTRALAKDACFDCHSNETVWPWYAKIAPSSWLLAHDVDEGRHELNFSEWGQGEMEVEEIAEVIEEGEMPPWYYALMHPDAKLSDSEKRTLIDGLQATVGQSGGDHS